MFPVTTYPRFKFVNGDVAQFQSKLFILYKMSLVSNVFINSSLLNIEDGIVLVNVDTVEIYCFIELCIYVFLHIFIIYYFTIVYHVHAFVQTIWFGFSSF